tara:strand:- start:3326 stop:3451 length:126 start_codon:yes stop_codon:yes gene_type:complete
MDLPIDDKEFDLIITQLWKSRKSESEVKDLYEKLKSFRETL